MTDLSSDTVLKRAPSLSVDLGPPTTIRGGKKQLASVPNALAIQEEFAQRTMFSESMKWSSFQSHGAAS